METQYLWTLTSSGAASSPTSDLRTCSYLTFYVQANGSSATIGIEVSRSSTSPFVRMGSTAYSVPANGAVVIQFDGPVGTARPYLLNASTVVVECWGV